MKLNIYLDDIREIPNHLEGLWIPIRTAEDVIYLLKKGVVKDMSLDHDLGKDYFGHERLNGYELLCYMERDNLWPKGKIYVHSANPVGREKMLAVLKKREGV